MRHFIPTERWQGEHLESKAGFIYKMIINGTSFHILVNKCAVDTPLIV